MRVLAAAFEDAASAGRALEELRHRFRLDSDDVGIAPLGGEARDARSVLAGHFAEGDVVTVGAIVHEFGGEVISDVDETWTFSPPSG